jgi:nucleotide-binding universal stress UspA family protein
MRITGPVLVGSDLTDASDEALRQGFRLAQQLQSRLLVCHVLPDLAQVRVLFPQWAGTDPTVASALDERGREAVRVRARTVIGIDLAAADVVLETGSPHGGIRAAAERTRAGVVVVGAGATAARLAHHASWAVLAARPSPLDGDVLAATDFSDPSLPAVVTDTMAAAARAQLDDAVRRIGTPAATLVTHGPAAARIIAAATQPPAALVVVGTHGRTGVPRWILGSVAERVVRDAPCAVLVVPLGAGSAGTEVTSA